MDLEFDDDLDGICRSIVDKVLRKIRFEQTHFATGGGGDSLIERKQSAQSRIQKCWSEDLVGGPGNLELS